MDPPPTRGGGGPDPSLYRLEPRIGHYQMKKMVGSRNGLDILSPNPRQLMIFPPRCAPPKRTIAGSSETWAPPGQPDQLGGAGCSQGILSPPHPSPTPHPFSPVRFSHTPLHRPSFPLRLGSCVPFDWVQSSGSWWTAVSNRVRPPKVPPTPSLSSPSPGFAPPFRNRKPGKTRGPEFC